MSIHAGICSSLNRFPGQDSEKVSSFKRIFVLSLNIPLFALSLLFILPLLLPPLLPSIRFIVFAETGSAEEQNPL